MNYCSNCGEQLNSNQEVCLNCGVLVKKNFQTYVDNVNDTGGFGWGALGFFVPIAGLILFIIWKDEKPKTAKAAGVGALISVLTFIIAYILIIILALLFAAML